MVWAPNEYEYPREMEERGCIYLGENFYGVIFPYRRNLHISEVPRVLREIHDWLDTEIVAALRGRPSLEEHEGMGLTRSSNDDDDDDDDEVNELEDECLIGESTEEGSIDDEDVPDLTMATTEVDTSLETVEMMDMEDI
jgi:hypothetical protein